MKYLFEHMNKLVEDLAGVDYCIRCMWDIMGVPIENDIFGGRFKICPECGTENNIWDADY